MSKVLIIGGGIAGLTAGIYAQKNGLQSVIHEKHYLLGGQCAYWKRHGYLLDNCVHWMTGTNPNYEVNQVWREVNVLSDELPPIQHPSFLLLEHQGQQLTLWQDLDRLRAELLRIAPDEAKAVNDFVDTIDAFQDVILSITPPEKIGLIGNLKYLRAMRRVGPYYRKLSRMSVTEYGKYFRNPLLKKLCTAYLPDEFNALSMFYTYATFCSGNGALPQGGSKGMIDRMQELYLSLGGNVVTSHEASRIVVEKGRAVAVEFSDGTRETADWIVPACDTYETFSRLLPEGYSDRFFSKCYSHPEKYRVYTTFNCYIAYDGLASELMDQYTMLIEGQLDLLGTSKSEFLIKNFDYEPSFAPQGHSIIQGMVALYENDFDKWKALYDTDRDAYKHAKEAVALKMIEYMEARFPAMKGKLTLLDVATPVTHHRFCNAYKGAYMSFIYSKRVPKTAHKGRVKGIKNLILTGQWLMMPGGLPNAAVSGKYAIDRILNE